MKKNFSKQILGLCLAAAVALTSIGANVTEAWAKSSEASVVGASVENATVLGTSTVTSALAEMGYSSSLYESTSTENASASQTVTKTIKVTETGDICGMLIAPSAQALTCTITMDGTTVLSQSVTTDDWSALGSNSYYLPFIVYPSVCGTGTLSLSFTFTSSSQYLLYVSQATTADTTFAFGSVEQSSYGNSFYAYIDSCPTSARGIEYRVCTKKGTEVYSSYASTSSEYLYISSSAITKRTIYYIQARTYAYDSSYNKVYSGWSDKKYFISRPDVKTSATKKTLSTHSVTLKWYKVTGATKYIVYCSTKQSSGYKKVGTTTKTSLKVTKFKNKTISFTSKKYFKIIAVTKVGGKTVKSTPYYAYAQVY